MLTRVHISVVFILATAMLLNQCSIRHYGKIRKNPSENAVLCFDSTIYANNINGESFLLSPLDIKLVVPPCTSEKYIDKKYYGIK